jgi:translocation and assembly module TamA
MLYFMTGLFNFFALLKIQRLNMLRWTKFSLLITLACLVSPKTFAISLPFGNEGIPFEIVLKDVETNKKYIELIDLIKKGIQVQRKENVTLKQYSDPDKISRFELDITRRILKSQGYYRHFVNSKLIIKNDNNLKKNSLHRTDTHIEKIIYKITPGTQYKLIDIEFELDKNINLQAMPELAIQIADALIAENVYSSLVQIRNYIRRHYCFYDIKIDYKAIIDHRDASAKIVFKMEPSQQTKFGPVFIKGLETIDYAYIKSFIDYDEGQCFKRVKIDSSRLSVLRSNLISNVRINVSDIENDQVITIYSIDEKNHRTVKAGIGYSSDEGTYLTSGWEHRNFSGAGEKLDISTRLSSIRQKVLGDFLIPAFFNNNKSLTLYSEAKNEELDSYKALSLKAGAKVGFQRSEFLHYFIGAELKISDVNDEGEKEAFYLLSFPIEVEWDHTNDILDSTDGFLITAVVRPYIDIINTETKFYKTMFSISGYHSFDIALQPTIAARYSVGTITGESVDNIPADERFYVGGGGSVRGYAYQSLSRLDGDDPEGGSSFQQINTELRIRFLENWGLATFVGGGFAFDEATPGLKQETLWGTGFGLRYYTAFAPFRMDIAFPLNKRENYDDNFQLYISIGQAF